MNNVEHSNKHVKCESNIVGMGMSSALSIRNKCTSRLCTGKKIAACSTASIHVPATRAATTAINELKFRPIKDIFTRNKIICCSSELYTLKGMKWNKCEIYVFPLFIGLLCCVEVVTRFRLKLH